MNSADQVRHRLLNDLATRLFEAIEAGDVDTFLACFEPEAQVIRNGTAIVAIAAVADRLREPANGGRHRYSEVRRRTFRDGFVEEHAVRTESSDGSITIRHSCVVGMLGQGERLAEMREYMA